MDQTLIDIYYKLISWDHHKSRDLSFIVEVSWRDGKPSYYAIHEGYINQYSSEVNSLEAGWDFLNTELSQAIQSQVEYCKKCLEMTDEEAAKNWITKPPFTKGQLQEFEDYVE